MLMKKMNFMVLMLINQPFVCTAVCKYKSVLPALVMTNSQGIPKSIGGAEILMRRREM